MVSGGLSESVHFVLSVFFFFKQKTAYEMRISDWSSDVCSSDLCSCAQTSSLDVGARLAAACSSKLALEPVRRCRHDVSQTRPPCVGLAVFAAFLWHFEPSVHRQTFDGIAECQSFMVGQKTDHVAMHSASETMVETLVVVHGEEIGR